MIHFTSDLHLFHIMMATIRKFKSVQEMNETLVNNWNSVVGKYDDVYFLGDLFLGRASQIKELEALIYSLNGNIFWIKGNHDRKTPKIIEERFRWIKDIEKIKIIDEDHPHGKQEIILCHYAMRTWNKAHHGSWHLYGHSHGDLPDDPASRSFDVGVDCHNFTPITYQRVKEIILAKEVAAEKAGLKFYGHHAGK